MSDKSGFRSAESRQRYLAVYDRVPSLSQVPDAVHDVPTEFGTVRVYQHGPDGGVPLVLLHCFWATSAMWAEHIPALAGEFTVYAVDMLGQPGASVQTKSMATADHCARCMNEVLDGLGLNRVHLVGYSYGGWTAAQTAARVPDRLASVTLIRRATPWRDCPGSFGATEPCFSFQALSVSSAPWPSYSAARCRAACSIA